MKRPKQLRLLWTMQAPQRVVAAVVFSPHPNGTKLRVYFEPQECDDGWQNDVHAFDVIGLDQTSGR